MTRSPHLDKAVLAHSLQYNEQGPETCRLCNFQTPGMRHTENVEFVMHQQGLKHAEFVISGTSFFLVLTKMSWRSPLTSQYSR